MKRLPISGWTVDEWIPHLESVETGEVAKVGVNSDHADKRPRESCSTTRPGNPKPRGGSGGSWETITVPHEPRLILCDEPTAALDHAIGEAVMELLADSAVHPNRTVIVVTHDSRVFHYADAIAHMDDGRIVKIESGRTDEMPEFNGVPVLA